MPEIATLPRLLKELRLPAIARQWQAVEKSALEHHWTLGQYLAALCEQELAHRHEPSACAATSPSHPTGNRTCR